MGSFRDRLCAQLLIALLASAWPQSTLAEAELMILSQQGFNLRCAPNEGAICLVRADGSPIFDPASAAVELGTETLISTDAKFSHRVEEGSSQENLLPGRQLIVTSTDRLGSCEMQLRATLLTDRPGAVFELQVRNTGTTDMELRSPPRSAHSAG